MKRIFLIFLFILCSIICCGQTFPVNYRDHNEINTCKNLLEKYTLDELSAMISSGNFDDIYVGDYIEMEMTTANITSSNTSRTEKVRWLVAAIDYFRHRTDVDLLDHHIVLVAEDCFVDTQKMNSSNTTAGGYASSSMYITVLPKYDTAITNAFGSSHVLSYHQLLTTSTNTTAPSMAGNNFTGCSNNWAWATGATNMPHVTKLNLMSEPQIFGTKICLSSFYDIGINNSQFPLFSQMPEKIICGRGFNAVSSARHTFWLSSVVSTTYFALCGNIGYATGNGASYILGVRPYFLFK